MRSELYFPCYYPFPNKNLNPGKLEPHEKNDRLPIRKRSKKRRDNDLGIESLEMEMGRRKLVEGEGFRVGWDFGGGEFVGLVGTGEWAVELTEEEWADFRRLLNQLAETMAAMAIELMEEEALSVELETDRIWMEVKGFAQCYGLRFMTQGGRRVEGEWLAETVPGLLAAIAQMEVEALSQSL